MDEQTIEQFDADLSGNLYKIWNRMSSGTYFPPPVRAVAIPKKSPIRCFVKDVFFHIPGFQPLLENGSIHGDVSQKPIMRNSVETGLDIAL